MGSSLCMLQRSAIQHSLLYVLHLHLHLHPTFLLDGVQVETVPIYQCPEKADGIVGNITFLMFACSSTAYAH